MSRARPLPPVPCVDFVVALHRAGFAVTAIEASRVALRRGDRTVVVPRHRVLQPPELLLLLRAARIAPQELLDLLAGAGDDRSSGVRARLDLDEPAPKHGRGYLRGPNSG